MFDSPILTLNEVEPYSFIFEQPLPLGKHICQGMIDLFEKSQQDHYQGVVGNGDATDVKVSTDMLIRKQPEWQEYDEILYQSLGESVRELCVMNEGYAAVLNTQDVGYQIQRTDPGGFYSWHIDGSSPLFKERMLVAIWYLNDDFEGGHTEFKHQDISIKPATGKLILFPPFWTHLHQGTPVISGVKYIATTWVALRG